MPMTTGSDTRMYSPRSEANLGYSKDDGGYDHGIGDPETMEQLRDQKMKEKEQATSADDLPHLQLSIPKPEPQMPPMMPEEEEEPPMMDDQFNEGQQFGAMTGMPDMGNLSIGNATGTMPAPGGMLATGEPMEDAWSTLMKSRLDDAGKAPPKNWRQSWARRGSAQRAPHAPWYRHQAAASHVPSEVWASDGHTGSSQVDG